LYLAILTGKTMPFGPVFELSSLNGANGFQINGESAYDRSGASVASAGDVNGDGFDDLVIGAEDAGRNGSGASYVVFGKAGGFAANLNLAALNGSNGFQLSGEAALDRTGQSVASAGDVNGDGFDDVVVGAPRADSNGTSSGVSYVVFGKAGGFSPNLDLSTLNGRDGFQISGEAASDYSGGSVASAGDVNGDGFDDLIIGASGANSNGAYSGASYLVFGKAGRFPSELNLFTLDGSNGFQISGELAGDYSGSSVASAGDVNGDGIDDLIVGAFGADPNGARSGASYVVFGKAGEFPASFDLSTLNGTNGFQISGEAVGDSSGITVASAGDVNGDGFDDVIAGARYADSNGRYSGASYVVFGKADGFSANFNLAALNGRNGFQVSGEAASDASGGSVASAGDVNGDGFADLIVGATYAAPNGSYSGASYVVFGKAGGFSAEINLATLDGIGGFKINGEASGDVSGGSVASAGDVDGDGFDDLVIASLGADTNGRGSGATYVIFGMATGAINRTGTREDEFFAGGEFDDALFGAGGSDRLVGNRGDDDLKGSTGSDTLVGGSGDDILRGGRTGADNLSGGSGRDRLVGGGDKDTLAGGTGGDLFAFTRVTDSLVGAPRDRITDFGQGEDRIDLRMIDADGNAANGYQAFAFRGTSSFTSGGGEVRYAQVNGNTIVSGDIDGDRVPDFQIRLDGLFSLTDGDFVL